MTVREPTSCRHDTVQDPRYRQLHLGAWVEPLDRRHSDSKPLADQWPDDDLDRTVRTQRTPSRASTSCTCRRRMAGHAPARPIGRESVYRIADRMEENLAVLAEAKAQDNGKPIC